MKMIENRIYYLLTVSRTVLLREFSFGFGICGGYAFISLVFVIIDWGSSLNLIASLVCVIGIGVAFFLLDRNRLVVVTHDEAVIDTGAETPPAPIVKTEESLMEEATEEQMDVFSFKDLVTDCFACRDAERMSDLLSNRNESLLKEVLS